MLLASASRRRSRCRARSRPSTRATVRSPHAGWRRHFGHLQHEGGLRVGQVVGRADAVWMASMGPEAAARGRHRLPMLASKAIRPPWRMKVLLPPMLGPVMICMRVRASSRQSLGMNSAPLVSARRACTTGWRPASMSMQGWPTNRARHQFSVAARSASVAQRSSPASARASWVSGRDLGVQRVEHLFVQHFSRASARSWADRALSSKALSSGVMKRSAFFSVWRRW